MRKRILYLITIALILVGVYGTYKKVKINNQINVVNVSKDSVIQDKEKTMIDSRKFMHLSLDDVIEPFNDIFHNDYTSIFENETLGLLKSLNDEYNAVFSLYFFYENEDKSFNLSEMPDKYSKEFQENADWLKVGFHSLNNETNYSNAKSVEAKNDYELVIEELLRITGTSKSIDNVPRLHNYSASDSSIQGFKESEFGIKGLLGPDDKRLSYNLNVEQTSYLYLYDYYLNEGLSYFKTDIRLENVENINKELFNLVNNKKFKDNNQALVIFTHEQLLKEDDGLVRKLIDAVEFGYKNDYEFDFPSNRVQQ